MSTTPEQFPRLSINDEIGEGIVNPMDTTPNSDKSQLLSPEEAPFSRAAAWKAKQLREEHADPGDAYLLGILHLKEYQVVTAAVHNMLEDFDPDAELHAS